MIRKIKNYFHLIEAILANIKYGLPSKKIKVIGVTGTDGKTTTTGLIYHILKESGKKVAMISTVGAFIEGKQYDIGFHVTTPSSFGLQKYIKKAVDKRNEYLVLEVTSHGLDQNRVYGIDFKYGVLTNITHEHLDYHKTYAKYVEAKLKLLERANIRIINMDDESFVFVKGKLENNCITYSINNKNANYNRSNFSFETQLVGSFNIQNCLAAIAVCDDLGIDREKIKKAILTFVPPSGRQEIVYNKDFCVMVDFAHTPNAFLKILPEASNMKKGRLIHVFGSAGRRDASKRPLMGEASSKYCDIIVLTAEDPRDESINEINKQIVSKIDKRFKYIDYKSYKDNPKDKCIYFKINDRKKAIEFAISIAKKGDLVITTGKSHEKSMNYGKGEEEWNEFEAVSLGLKSRNQK